MCKQCGKETEEGKACPHCGSNPGTAEKNSGTTEKIQKTLILALVGLAVNLLVCPGVGTLLGGLGFSETPAWKDTKKKGIWQLVLFLAGAILSVIGIGIILMVIAWIWALISSIKQLKGA